MSKKSYLSLSIAALVVLGLGAERASAQDTRTVVGPTYLEECAAAAAAADRAAKVGIDAVLTCNKALAESGHTLGEQASAYLDRGVLRMARGEHGQAIADFNNALKIQPYLAVAYNDRGIAQSALHQFAKAEADFTQALGLAPSHPEQVLFNRAMAYEDMGDLKRAYLDYRKAAELAPGWDKPAIELARFSLSRPPVS
jgi:tetratricopeptide (TPR) repeat protein